MSSRCFSATAALAVALTTLSAAVACDEDGKTTPERCPELPLYDITRTTGGAPAGSDVGSGGQDDGCVTPVGRALSPSGGAHSSNGGAQAGADTDEATAGMATAGAASNAGAGGA